MTNLAVNEQKMVLFINFLSFFMMFHCEMNARIWNKQWLSMRISCYRFISKTIKKAADRIILTTRGHSILASFSEGHLCDGHTLGPSQATGGLSQFTTGSGQASSSLFKSMGDPSQSTDGPCQGRPWLSHRRPKSGYGRQKSGHGGKIQAVGGLR